MYIPWTEYKDILKLIRIRYTVSSHIADESLCDRQGPQFVNLAYISH